MLQLENRAIVSSRFSFSNQVKAPAGKKIKENTWSKWNSRLADTKVGNLNFIIFFVLAFLRIRIGQVQDQT